MERRQQAVHPAVPELALQSSALGLQCCAHGRPVWFAQPPARAVDDLDQPTPCGQLAATNPGQPGRHGAAAVHRRDLGRQALVRGAEHRLFRLHEVLGLAGEGEEVDLRHAVWTEKRRELACESGPRPRY
jgi:hypothetical protein